MSRRVILATAPAAFDPGPMAPPRSRPSPADLRGPAAPPQAMALSPVSALILALLTAPTPFAAQAGDLDLPAAGSTTGSTAGGESTKPRTGSKTKRGQQPSTAGNPSRKRRGDLDLPSRMRHEPTAAAPVTPAAAPVAGTPPPSALRAAAVEPLPSSPAGLEAEAILVDLAGLREPGVTRVSHAADQLARLGADVLPACRAALEGEHAAPLVAAGRVLLEAGDDQDRARVVARFDGKLPRRAAESLLSAIEDLAPRLLTPELLGHLFEHPQGATRSAAERRLRAMPTAEALPILLRSAESGRADTRLRALGLLATGGGPESVELFFDHLSDTSAKVAWRAAQNLAALDDAAVRGRLIALATGESLLLRSNAYALLAVCEMEDRTSTALLDMRHALLLQDNLNVSQPLTVGAVAVALAGIGFRSPRPEDTPWLDRIVPHLLVRTVSGAEYHRDIASLREPSERRLALITGESIANDGRAWQRWWIDNSVDFRARRAYLSLGALGPEGLEVRFRAPSEGSLFRLLGEQAVEHVERGPDFHGEVFYLTRAECEDLASVLRGEGILSAERLPGTRGTSGSKDRTLEVVVGNQAKAFTFAQGVHEEWFERAASAVRGLADRNRWQLYVDPSRHVSRRELWLAERDWWARVTDETSRARRMKQLVLAALPSVPVSQRDEGVAELRRAFALEGVADASDFQPLLELLRQEPLYRDRAIQLAELARQVAREASGAGRPIEIELARELAEALHDSFGVESADQLVLLLAECGRDVMEEKAHDERPFVRAVTAGALARRGEPEDVALLLEMLEDPDPDVEASVVRSMGAHGIGDARVEILLRARVGERRVRAAALEALSHLGGADVVEPLMLAVNDPDPAIRNAAAEGLAVLADPRTAGVLVSVLARGPAEPNFDAARRGLLAIGEPAWMDLLRVASSAAPVSRREAALVLSEQGVPQVASTLMAVLTEGPADQHVAAELATLTCIDFRSEPDPAGAWWEWWDQVRHDDSLAWFRAALSRAGLEVPPTEAFEGQGTRACGVFLAGLLARDEGYLVERARRELSRLFGVDLGEIPLRGSARELWLEELRQRIDSHWAAIGARPAPESPAGEHPEQEASGAGLENG